MQSMQRIVIDKIEEIAVDSELSIGRQTRWANIGRIYAMEGARIVWELEYNFQTTYCTLHVAGPGVDALAPVDAPPLYRVSSPAGVLMPDAQGEYVISFFHLDYGHLEDLLDVLSGASEAMPNMENA